MMAKLMIVAGEPSGDAHAAALARALREAAPGETFEFFGATGLQMREAGVESVVEAETLAIIGLVEEIKALPKFWAAFKKLRAAAVERQPDAVILVDWPDFNLRLATSLRRRGFRVIYYISPQLWAWRSYRLRNIRRDVDLLLSILPFEKDWYAERGVHHVEYVGNPLAGEVAARFGRAEVCRRNKLDKARPLVALLPGSRRHEIRHILPPMLDAAELMLKSRPELQFIVPVANNRRTEEIAHLMAGHPRLRPRIHMTQGETREVVAAADVAAVASGTATLETALLNTPLAVVYKTGPVSYHLLRPLINVEHFGLVNLVAGERVAKELIQRDFTGATLANELLRLLETDTNSATRKCLREVTDKLGHGGASRRAAKAIQDALASWQR
jgi:lipid-A-disaccharide synthase